MARRRANRFRRTPRGRLTRKNFNRRLETFFKKGNELHLLGPSEVTAIVVKGSRVFSYHSDSNRNWHLRAADRLQNTSNPAHEYEPRDFPARVSNGIRDSDSDDGPDSAGESNDEEEAKYCRARDFSGNLSPSHIKETTRAVSNTVGGKLVRPSVVAKSMTPRHRARGRSGSSETLPPPARKVMRYYDSTPDEENDSHWPPSPAQAQSTERPGGGEVDAVGA